MLGFAVVDAPSADAPVAVWLVSCTSDSWAENTNAVTFQPEDDLRDARVLAMIADRYIFLTHRTPADAAPATQAAVQAAPRSVLSDAISSELTRLVTEYADDTKRRRGRKMAALIEPQWPILPDPDAPPRDPDAPAALIEADRVRALWTTWLRLESIRVQRPYLTPHDEEPQLLPPGFTEVATVHPLATRS